MLLSAIVPFIVRPPAREGGTAAVDEPQGRRFQRDGSETGGEREERLRTS